MPVSVPNGDFPALDDQVSFQDGVYLGYGNDIGFMYTYSRTEQKFAAIGNGKYYPASYDRPNDLSAAGVYKLTKRWTVSGTFVYATGNAVSYPTGKYVNGGLTTFSYSGRNNYRG